MRWLWCLSVVLPQLPAVALADVTTRVDIAGLDHNPQVRRTEAFTAGVADGGSCQAVGATNCTGTISADAPNFRVVLSQQCIDELIPSAANDPRGWGDATLTMRCEPQTAGGTPTDIVVTWPTTPEQIRLSENRALVGNGNTELPSPQDANVVAYRNNVWLTLTDHEPATLRSHSVVFYRADAAGEWKLTTVETVTTNSSNQPQRGVVDRWCGASDPERFCADELSRVRQGVCFVERTPNDLQLIRSKPEDHVIRANTSFTVVACIASEHTLRGTLSGTVGLTDPAIDDQSNGGPRQGGPQTSSTGAPTNLRVVRLSFAPRRPGALELALKLRTRANTLVDELQTELIVEQTYSGALRLGIGVPLYAVQRTYTAELAPGSAHHEIVGSGSDVDVELVITFAGFLEALYGGRSYTSSGSNFFERWGLFVAAGVLAPSAEGVRFLTSFYVGIELEIIRSLSFGVGFVLRRVDRLISGYSVGDAVLDGTRLSGESWEPGLGFVIGVSPEFLQFAGALGDG